MRTVTWATNICTLTGKFHYLERRGFVARAYVMAKTETGTAEKVQDELRRVPGIQTADIVTGEYDLVVVVEGPSNEDIGRLVMRDIQGISGVGPTTTFVVIG